jgi:glycosyltransferase involved in cell wall biosynthesis
MKKILVISYMFPPSARAGAHRAYSMAEMLPKYGWSPIFIAPLNGYFGRLPRFDESLLKIVNKFPVVRIPLFYPCNNNNQALFARAARRFWETVLLPDGYRLWNRGVKNALSEVVLKYKPDVVFITAPPFSHLLLAPFIKRKFHLPVVLDYRDPWTGNPVAGPLWRRSWAALSFEKKILPRADLITTASYYIIDFMKKHLGSIVRDKQFFGFPYGFNGDFFKKEILPIMSENFSEIIRAVFAGTQIGDLSAEKVLKGIRITIDTDSEIAKKVKFSCYGTIFGYSGESRTMIKKYGLGQYISYYPFLPYMEFLRVLRQASFLIQPLGIKETSVVVYPTKFFDYLGVKRPILYIGGDGQVSETIKSCHAGICCGPEPEQIAKSLKSMVNRVHKDAWYSDPSSYNKFDRKNIFADFCQELDRLVGSRIQ